jgi:shikimate dehydrogenase
MNIYIIGMPGSGKTSLGKAAAEALGLPFLDMDAEIEKAEGMPIRDIFSQKGEAYFRERESALLADNTNTTRSTKREQSDLQSEDNSASIISTGGGVVLRESNVRAMREQGLVIFIDRPLQVLEESVKPQAERPLVQAGADLEKLYRERISLYRKAAHCVVDNSRTVEDALADLEAAIGLSGILAPFMVIGDPIGHSLSPALHTAAFEKLTPLLQARAIPSDGTSNLGYIPVRVRAAFLPQALEAFRAGWARGMNVTIPHKATAARLVDKIEGDAVKAQAVNTIVKRGGLLYGYNTDMDGLEAALARHGRYYKGSNIIISGAGGAASGIIAKAQARGAKSLTIICRNAEKAEKLIASLGIKAEVIEHDFSTAIQLNSARNQCLTVSKSGGAGGLEKGGTRLRVGPFARPGPAPFISAIKRCDIFLNATPLGMSGTSSDSADLSFLESLPKTCFVCDLVYKPAETQLLKRAKEAGLASMNGLDMLVFQGILADELFLGIKEDHAGSARNDLYQYIIGKLQNGNG